MTTTETVPQLNLPGQAAAPEGPVDLVGMWVMHHAFRRDLAAFAAAVPATPVTDRRTWRALRRRWALFSFVLHHHHAGEDTGLWPLLRDRADAAGRAVLDAMEADHAEIDPLLAGCADGFDTLAARADADTRAALVVRVSAAREALLRHLAAEETDALAMVQAHLAPAEWEHLENTVFRAAYGPRDLLRVLPWAFHGLPAHARGRMFGPGGAPLLLVWRLALRAPFERADRRAFAHVIAR